ncbi:MAG: glycosyl hydrolase family 18 protein [Candidatus Limnocylindria bacterium]
MLPRHVSVGLMVVLSLVAFQGRAVATDDQTAPEAAVETEVPSVHAEMLAEHSADEIAFAPGDVPQARPGTNGTGGSVTAAVGSLPNGLRREVLGYLPYWMLGSSDLARMDYSLVSTIAYFSVGARSDGSLERGTSATPSTGWSGWNSSAMSQVISAAHARDVKVVLTVTMMAWSSSTPMQTLLSSSTSRARLAGEIAATVKSRNADGVNLDFEPVPSSLEASFTDLVRRVKAELLRQGAGSHLSVATTAGAGRWSTGYDLAALTAPGAADHLMVMAYDLNWSGSARAGGVAPIDSPHVLDSREAMADYLSIVPASRLIWGVPYYGRAWTTQTGERYALTCKSASICPGGITTAGTFGRTWAPRYTDAIEAAATHGRRWDDIGRVPWYAYQSSTYGTWVQGYYDDAASLTAKYDLVNANGLAGVGIWHLLMDGTRRDLWSAIDTNLRGAWFEDIIGSPFRADILWIAEAGITSGCAYQRYCPKSTVTREQMASFLARALRLPPATRDWFSDDSSSPHQADINRLAEAGITGGCATGRFCPSANVPRQQMASFLARALRLPPSTRDWFADDNGSPHEGDINRLADAGITGGCTTTAFCGTAHVLRDQMAAFLHRSFR